MGPNKGPFGIMGQFSDEHSFVEAVRQLRNNGYAHLEAFSPLPFEEIMELTPAPPVPLSVPTFIGGVSGTFLAFVLEYVPIRFLWPMDIGGRPLFSWPTFIPIMFELTVLLATFGALIGLLVYCKLPQYFHPVFLVEDFKKAFQDQFFVLVKSSDPEFQQGPLTEKLLLLGATHVHEVPRE